MAQSPTKDPFLWDTDRVCKELCLDGAQWTNDTAALESLLRENFMDGETLLTYELTFSRKELVECLGIAAARHQIKLIRKISQLQKQSPKFHEAKRSIESDGVDQVSSPAQMPNVPVASPSQRTFLRVSPPPLQPTPAIPERRELSEEQPSKRRRLAPTFVADIQPGAAVQRMPGFEEPELGTPPGTRVVNSTSSEEDLSTAQLWKKGLDLESIIPLDPDYSSDSSSDNFSSVRAPQPRGMAKVIYSRLKKHFLKNNKKISSIRSGVKVSTSSDGDRDVVNFDDLASLDEDTLREIAEEEAEKKEAKSSSLSLEKVEEVINAEISKFQTQWQENKLPKLEQKAYHLWSTARKHSVLRQRTFEAQQEARHFRDRLSSLTSELRLLPWKTPEELRFQTCIVEQTVVDKLRQEWLANLFSLRRAPPKPSRAQTYRQRRPKRTTHEDQLLSSSEEEPLDHFIVEDDSASVRAISPLPLQSALSPTASGDLSLAPLNNQSMPQSPVSSVMAEASQPKPFIDLTMTSDAEIDGPTDKMVPCGFDPVTQDVLAQIGEKHPRDWVREMDRFRLVISMLWRLDFERRDAVFQLLNKSRVSAIWLRLIGTARDRTITIDEPAKDAVFDLTLVYLSFQKCKYYKEQRLSKLSPKDVDKMEDSGKSFPSFCAFLATIKDEFPQRNQIGRLDEDDGDLIEIDRFSVQSSTKSGGDKKKKKKKKKKAIILDKSGVELRERAARDMMEQERRRDELRAAIQQDNSINAASTKSPRLIINESKTDDEGFIYVHPLISSRIKDHQIEGVRFLWNHVVRDKSERQGCLLAHTMGLGKTMQTITFLVALRESALSNQLRDQIPEDLRNWKVLVICPAGLVENWKDEFAIWAPARLLGAIITIEAVHPPFQRMKNARRWAADGGVLIIGYTMFKSGFRQGDETNTTLDRILVDNAAVVIADEAHHLKNPKTKITQVASEIKTSTRIALTGSPLANNVEEYYAMINWVAPNFLGPLQEFRDMYATPIHQGLWHDSPEHEKREAIKLLQVLKKTAAPKVHRATMKSCHKLELPQKEEFVISVPPTEMQRKLYDLYMQANASSNEKVNQANLFGVLNHLSLICAHPAAYRKMVIELSIKSDKGHDVPRFPMEAIPQIMKITADPKLDRTELSYKVELLNKILDQSSQLGDKVLVFSQSILTLNYLTKLFTSQGRDFCRLDGNTKIERRQDMVKKFNSGSATVYLISTTAGGVGLNIQGANRVVIFDFKWNPVQDQQAIGRAYRIGQKKSVFVYRFVVAGSFEEDLQNKAVFKTQLAARVVDQRNVVSWSKRLTKLLHLIKHVDATESRFDFKGKDVILDHILDHADTKAIVSIMSSDTFEEEDETETLTAEERQEADSMVEQHKLRMTDPDKYSQMVQAERIASTQRSISHIASGKPKKDWFPERPDHAFEPNTLYNQTPLQHSAPASAPATATATPLLSSGSMPIQGANTYHGNSGPRMTNAQSPLVPSNGPNTFSAASSVEARDRFQYQLATAWSAAAAQYPPLQFEAFAKSVSVTGDIEVALAKQEKGHAADTLRWNMLAGKLGNRKLLLAIAAGQISGQFLGTTEEGSMETRIQGLQNIADGFFLEQIRTGGRPKDPEVRAVERN